MKQLKNCLAMLLLLFTLSSCGLMEAKRKSTENILELLSAAVKQYYEDEGVIPYELGELVEKRYINNSAKGFKDGWGTEIFYTVDSEGKKFTLISYGSDRKEGGSGFAEDIVVETEFAED